MRLGLTPDMKKLYDFIKAYSENNKGGAPTYQEMCDHLGLVSKSNINRMMVAMKKRGWINYDKGANRSVAIIPEDERIAIGTRLVDENGYFYIYTGHRKIKRQDF